MTPRFQVVTALLSLVVYCRMYLVDWSAEAETQAEPTRKATFYVATDGNDEWSGRLPSPNRQKTNGPFATLARAQDAMRQMTAKDPGSRTVMVRGGRYFLDEPLTFGPQDSGSKESPVRYIAYDREQPILSGGKRLADWKPYKDQILQCDVPEVQDGQWKFRQLFYSGDQQIRAR